MLFHTGPLHQFLEHLDRMLEIIHAVNAKTGSTEYTSPGYLQHAARRGDVGVFAFEGERLVGFSLLTEMDRMIAPTEAIELKIWLARQGYDRARVGMGHAFFLDPASWGNGNSLALMEARDGNGYFDFAVQFRHATTKLHDWFAKQPRAIDTGVLDEKGETILLRDMRSFPETTTGQTTS